MDWHKELERSLSSQQGEASIYDPAQYSASLIQASRGGGSPWGYRPPPQWPGMWMPQHRGAVPQVWGDPAFRSFFPESSEQAGPGWPPGPDPKPHEPSPHHGDPAAYRAPADGPAFPLVYPARRSPGSPPEEQAEGEQQGGSPPEEAARAGSQYRSPGPQFPSPGPEGEATPPHYSYHGTPPGQYPAPPGYSPRPDPREEGPPVEPQDFSCERTPREEQAWQPREEQAGYDIIRNMTEKYGGQGGEAREAAQGFETRRSNLESVLSKMSRSAEADGPVGPGGPEQGRGPSPGGRPGEEALPQSPPHHQKPIKLRIAGGEVVANTVLDGELEPIQVKTEAIRARVEPERLKRLVSPAREEAGARYHLDRSALTALHHSIQTDEVLKERVSDIVGEDVLSIFAEAVAEANNSREPRVDNKNVVFLYYAVKNSTHLDLESVKKAELEPLSNLALSTPLLSRLLRFVASDPGVREALAVELGPDLAWLEGVVAASRQRGEEFLQDPGLAPRAVPLYHAARNSVLSQAFRRMASLHSNTEAILSRTVSSEDPSYNTALARLQSLVSAPWSQQVIAAEAMKFDFEFLGTVYTFWRRVISSRASKPDRKTRKTKLKLDPSTFESFDRPKRSSRRRDEVITYDEDVLQNCVLKTGLHEVKQELAEEEPAN